MTEHPTVLFMCAHNAGRSLAAHGCFLITMPKGASRLNPLDRSRAINSNRQSFTLLLERGLEPTKEFPKPLTEAMANQADVIITMGCGDTCPVYPGKRYVDWELDG